MKQHVLAFLMALVVWVVGNSAMTMLPRALARSTSVIEGHCRTRYEPTDWWQQGCQILDTECTGACIGLVREDRKCVPASGTGWVCRDYPAIVPVYIFITPCKWRDTEFGRACQCDPNDPDTWREERDGDGEPGTWCSEEELA